MELRFVRRRKAKSGIVSVSKVLQWRSVDRWELDNTTGQLHNAKPIFTKWQDVPTVDDKHDGDEHDQ